MKEYKLGENTILVVEVPEDSHNYGLGIDVDTKNRTLSFDFIDAIDGWDWIDLPPGNWSILNKASSITEEQAKGLVEIFRSGNKLFDGKYYDYSRKNRTHTVADKLTDTALESWNSYLTANGIDKDDLILKKE